MALLPFRRKLYSGFLRSEKIHRPHWIEPANLGSRGEYDNHWTTGVDVGEVMERLELCSFSNPSVALPMSQLILQSFHCFTYVTAHSPTLLSIFLHHRLFTYVTLQAAHVGQSIFMSVG